MFAHCNESQMDACSAAVMGSWLAAAMDNWWEAATLEAASAVWEIRLVCPRSMARREMDSRHHRGRARWHHLRQSTILSPDRGEQHARCRREWAARARLGSAAARRRGRLPLCPQGARFATKQLPSSRCWTEDRGPKLLLLACAFQPRIRRLAPSALHHTPRSS